MKEKILKEKGEEGKNFLLFPLFRFIFKGGVDDFCYFKRLSRTYVLVYESGASGFFLQR